MPLVSPEPPSPAAVKVLSDLVKQFRALGHPADEAVRMAEVMLRLGMDEAARTKVAPAPSSSPPAFEPARLEQCPVGRREILHERMLWEWDSGRAAGPRCPEHRVPLFYQITLDLPPGQGRIVADYRDEWTEDGERRFTLLGDHGVFVCPIDRLTWPRIGECDMKLGDLRAQARALLRVKLDAQVVRRMASGTPP